MLRQDDMLEMLSLSRETFRYWRGKLPPLSMRGQGHKARYSTGDLLALKCVIALIQEHGQSISAVRRVAVPLFEACRHEHWEALRDKGLSISYMNGTATPACSILDRPIDARDSDDFVRAGLFITVIERDLHAETIDTDRVPHVNTDTLKEAPHESGQ